MTKKAELETQLKNLGIAFSSRQSVLELQALLDRAVPKGERKSSQFTMKEDPMSGLQTQKKGCLLNLLSMLGQPATWNTTKGELLLTLRVTINEALQLTHNVGKFKPLKMTTEQILKEESSYVDWALKEYLEGQRFGCPAMLRMTALALICGKGVVSKELGDYLAEEMEESKEKEKKDVKKEFSKPKHEFKKEEKTEPVKEEKQRIPQDGPIYTSAEEDEEDPKKKSRAAKESSSSEATS